MKRKRRFFRLVFLSVVIALYMGTTGALVAKAAAPEEFFNYAINSNRDPWSFALAVEQPGVGIVVYTNYEQEYIEASDQYFLHVASKTAYSMEYAGYVVNDSEGLLIWHLTDTADLNEDSPGILMQASPKTDQSAEIYYMKDENEGRLAADQASRTIGEVAREFDDGSALLLLDEGIPNEAYYPAIVANSNGECIGILYAENVLYVDWWSSGNSSLQLVLICAAVAVVVIVIAVLIKKRRKPKPSRGPTQNNDSYGEPVSPAQASPAYSTPTYTQPPQEPQVQTPPLYTSPESPSKYAQPAPKQEIGSLFLACSGGYMDGRVYPIQGPAMKIGRDVSCAIKYPSDYAGVSREHVTLRLENGTMTLYDTSSTGTFLKRIQGKIPNRQPVVVDVGDVFYVGERKNRYEIVRR